MAILSVSGSLGKRQAKVRSGFEKEIQSGRPEPYRSFKAGVNDLGKGTTIGFYSQHFAHHGKDILQNLKATTSCSNSALCAPALSISSKHHLIPQCKSLISARLLDSFCKAFQKYSSTHTRDMYTY